MGTRSHQPRLGKEYSYGSEGDLLDSLERCVAFCMLIKFNPMLPLRRVFSCCPIFLATFHRLSHVLLDDESPPWELGFAKRG